METLIAEDLLLLLLDDEKGTMTTSYPQTALGGAVLIELALTGAVEVEEKTTVWRSTKVHVTGQVPADDLLRSAYDVVAEKQRSAQDLVERLGKGTRDRLAQRLVALLGAIDKAHKVVDHRGLPAREVRKRAKQIGEGAWAAKAVRDAISAS